MTAEVNVEDADAQAQAIQHTLLKENTTNKYKLLEKKVELKSLKTMEISILRNKLTENRYNRSKMLYKIEQIDIRRAEIVESCKKNDAEIIEVENVEGLEIKAEKKTETKHKQTKERFKGHGKKTFITSREL